MTELLPCPFCGGEAKAFQHGDTGYVVQCRRCGIWNAGYHAAWSHITEDEFSGFVDEESAAAAWNARAERTCRITSEEYDDLLDVFTTHFSCGHYGIGMARWFRHCPECGAKVVSE